MSEQARRPRSDELPVAETAVLPPGPPSAPPADGGSTASAPRAACLVVVVAPAGTLQVGRQFELGTSTRIGCATDDHICLPADGVLPRHAMVHRDGDSVRVVPGSTCPILVRRESGIEFVATAETPLFQGDQLILGRIILELLESATPFALTERYHECVYRLTILDGITRAYNHRYLDEVLLRELPRTRKRAVSLAVVVVMTDEISQIEAVHGGVVADAAVRAIAGRLLSTLKGDGVLCRSGHGEFALVLPGRDLDDARAIAAELRTTLAAVLLGLPAGAVSVHARTGVAALEPGDVAADAVLQRARASLPPLATRHAV